MTTKYGPSKGKVDEYSRAKKFAETKDSCYRCYLSAAFVQITIKYYILLLNVLRYDITCYLWCMIMEDLCMKPHCNYIYLMLNRLFKRFINMTNYIQASICNAIAYVLNFNRIIKSLTS